MEVPIVISVCVLTYRRPDQLWRCLESVVAQAIPPGCDVQVFIIDNDAGRSAESLVAVAQSRWRSAMAITYVHQPKAGVATARNTALEVAIGWICFIDDDETADPDWLVRLVACMRRYDADAVFGPVLTRFPADCPPWARTSLLLNRRRSPTGTQRTLGASGNVLFRLDRCGNWNAKFRTRFDGIGGEDSDFFSRMHDAGGQFVWCDEAVCHEEVDAGRFRISWLLRRAAFNGIRSRLQSIDAQRMSQRVGAGLYGLLLGTSASVIALVLLPAGLARALPLMERAAYHLGRGAVWTDARVRREAVEPAVAGDPGNQSGD